MTRHWRCLGSNFTVDDSSLPVWWKFTFPQGWRNGVPGIREEMRTQATWPDSESGDLGRGAQTDTHHCVTMDIIFWAFNWPCEQILLATESGSGNVGYLPHIRNPAGYSDLEVWAVLWLCRTWGASHLRPHPPPCCSPLLHHHLFFWSLLGSLRGGPTWSYLSSSREEFRLSLPCTLVCPTIGMELGRNRTRGPSGLSVGDWALDLVLIQGTEPN